MIREKLDFAFEKCWTCQCCVYDMKKGHMCSKTGENIRRPHSSVCDDWEKGDFYMH